MYLRQRTKLQGEDTGRGFSHKGRGAPGHHHKRQSNFEECGTLGLERDVLGYYDGGLVTLGGAIGTLMMLIN